MFYCGNDVGVSTTTANIATQLFPDVRFGFSVSFSQHTDRGADLPWRAVATLVSIVIDKGLLHGRETTRASQAFYRRHFATVMHHGET